MTSEAESLLAPFAAAPGLDWLEGALRHLTASLASYGDSVPVIRVVRVGPSGVELVLAEPRSTAPGRFVADQDGRTWTLLPTTELAELPGSASDKVWLPALVPVGEDVSGTWLVPVEPGTVLPVRGPDASAVVAAMRITAGSWPWTESLEVATSPGSATAATSLVGPGIDTDERLRILCVGPMAMLGPGIGAHVGLVTTDEVAPTDVWIEATAKVVRLEPMGVQLRPCRLDTGVQEGVEALDWTTISGIVARARMLFPRGSINPSIEQACLRLSIC